MNLKKYFGTNKDKEQHGVWIDGPDGSKLLIARFGNPASLKLGKELMRPHRAAQRAGKLDDKVLEAVAIKVLANTVLLGWKGVRDGEGDTPPEIQYSPEAAERLMAAYHDFRAFVAEYASEASLFHDQEEKALEKN